MVPVPGKGQYVLVLCWSTEPVCDTLVSKRPGGYDADSVDSVATKLVCRCFPFDADT